MFARRPTTTFPFTIAMVVPTLRLKPQNILLYIKIKELYSNTKINFSYYPPPAFSHSCKKIGAEITRPASSNIKREVTCRKMKAKCACRTNANKSATFSHLCKQNPVTREAREQGNGVRSGDCIF